MQQQERQHADEFNLVRLGADGGKIAVAMVGVEPLRQGNGTLFQRGADFIHRVTMRFVLSVIDSSAVRLWMQKLWDHAVKKKFGGMATRRCGIAFWRDGTMIINRRFFVA
ncbi:MAG: hypothetical protein WDN00_04650 [Limisphaerales bacterium]